jgi:hypothetical protein
MVGGMAAWEPSPPRLARLVPLPLSPPPVVATGRLNSRARWQLDGEGGVAGGACVGSLDGW